jgi:tetratricopeptide (TPR) repeat protein
MKFCAAGLLVCVCAFAQMHDHRPPPDASPVDLAKLPAPRRMFGIGEAHITITTNSPEAQQWFDQGLELLHCFWDYEALRAFEQAARLDQTCAMCHWGIARALDFRGGEDTQVKEEFAAAKKLATKASDEEQRYIRAFADANCFQKEMEALIDRYPDDVEAKLMLALRINSGYGPDGDPRSGAVYAHTLLLEILSQHPDNAAANHYWIHAMESSDHPERALQSAEKLGMLAPDSGHMVHMPGHIFYRMGNYERARRVFLSSLQVDQTYMAQQHVSPRDDWNYAHNLSYLVADCAEEGRYKEAHEHAFALAGLANDPARSGNPGFYIVQIGSTRARLAIRYANWDEVIDHPMQFGVPDSELSVYARRYRDGLVEYARGMKAAEADQIAEADVHSQSLDALLWRASQEPLEKSEDKQIRDRVVKILSVASLELRGEIESRRGNFETARSLIERAEKQETDLGYAEPPQYAQPALEVLGAACIRAGKFEDARKAFSAELKKRPRSGFALYGIALAWDKQGDRGNAEHAYRDFLAAWAFADPDLPQVKAAQRYVSGVNGGASSSAASLH